MAWEALDVSLRKMLKESKKSRFDSYSARNSVLIISHITFRVVACTFFIKTFLGKYLKILKIGPSKYTPPPPPPKLLTQKTLLKFK